MKKAVLISTLLFLFCNAYSQSGDFQSLIDSGKAEFKNQAASQMSDYSYALKLLLQSVKANPNNAESRYFLGYAIDRINAGDGSTMDGVQRELTEKVSEQFEACIALEKQYSGEKLLLDPYSKITSIWGSLAQAYLTRQSRDSAVWAFKQGKQRGGFIEPILSYNRQLLNSCEKGAILFTDGDLITIPVWYLQTVEQYRTDLTTVDVNLLNTLWYAKYLKHQQKLNIGFSDVEIDTINYIAWAPATISIPNPKNAKQAMSWLLKPTYYDGYILRGDRIMLDILKQNLFNRTIYFSAGSDSTTNLYLHDFLVDDGIVDKLLLFKNDPTTKTTILSKNLYAYNINNLSADDIKKSQDAIFLLNMMRLAILSNCEFIYNKGELPEAKRLFAQAKQKFSVDKLPYGSDYVEQKITEMDILLKGK